MPLAGLIVTGPTTVDSPALNSAQTGRWSETTKASSTDGPNSVIRWNTPQAPVNSAVACRLPFPLLPPLPFGFLTTMPLDGGFHELEESS